MSMEEREVNGRFKKGTEKHSPINDQAKKNWYRDFRIKHELELEGYNVIR